MMRFTRRGKGSLDEAGPGAPAAGVSEPADARPEGAKPARRRLRDRWGKRRLRTALRKFFLPPLESSRWRRWIPWLALLGVIGVVVVASAYMWAWTNSPSFCGNTCHTMPPQATAYKLSPHSRVSCVECHIGREFILQQLPRKTMHSELLFRTAFGLYEYPIRAKGMRPARDACETCHAPAKFSDDSLVVNKHYKPDESNTSYSIYLVMKVGGGTQREGLGRGIHWHVENNIQYLSTDALDQTIPYIKVTNSDGTVQQYTDIESGLDPASIDPKKLKTMDCITCHNRISHYIATPEESVDSSLARGVISSDIPYIRREAVKALRVDYASQDLASTGIAGALTAFYKTSYPDFYAANAAKMDAAVAEVQRIYSVSVFPDQKIDWNTYPNNTGHIDSPGCFRCHDGKHLDATKKPIRLECNICHSIPVVQGSEGLVTDLELTHGSEPASHLEPNWIGLHNVAYLKDKSCGTCHSTGDDGGTSNVSFCSNSACHGTVFTFAGFDAPALRQVLQDQLQSTTTTAAPTPTTVAAPTWDSAVGKIFAGKCITCHSGVQPPGGLSLASYANIIAGGTDGPVIVPGQSANSYLLQVQSKVHGANLTPAEMALVKQWIDAGALQK